MLLVLIKKYCSTFIVYFKHSFIKFLHHEPRNQDNVNNDDRTKWEGGSKQSIKKLHQYEFFHKYK